MSDAVDEARIERALRGFRRFQRLKSVVSAIVIVVSIVVSIQIARAHGLLMGLLVFFVGSWIAAGILGVLVLLPLGYLLCGRDAMTLGREIEKRRAA